MRMLLEYFLLGVLFGGGLIFVTYTIAQVINKLNLPEIIREALRNSKEEQAKCLIGEAIEAQVKLVQGNTITLEMFAKAGSSEKIELQITGTGVDSSVKQGMKVAV